MTLSGTATYYLLKEIVTSLTLIFPIVVPASLVAVISAILAVFSPEKVSAPQGRKKQSGNLFFSCFWNL